MNLTVKQRLLGGFGLAMLAMTIVAGLLISIEARVDRLVTRSTAHADGGIVSEINTAVAIIIVAIIAIAAISLWLTKTITRHIAGLNSASDRMALGDVDVQFNAESKDEIGQLAQSMKAMATNIQACARAAEQIAAGDLSVEIKAASDDDVLAKSMMQVVETLRGLVAEANTLRSAAVEGRLEVRGDASRFAGGYHDIIQGFNDAIGSLVAHLDSVPSPVMIIDREFTLRYANRTTAAILNSTQDQIVGTKCYDHCKTSDCKTDRCACARAMQQGIIASSETDAHPNGLDLEIAYTAVPLKDEAGAVIGALEVITDQTAQVNAARLAQKVSDFQATEVARLVENLGRFAQGDLDFTLEVADGDADTTEVRAGFAQISHAVNRSTDAVRHLTQDANMLSQAAVEGKLETRADASKHQGDYGKIIGGVNDTLDSVISPLNMAANYVDMISKGELPEKITDDYNGDFNVIKANLNTCIDSLNMMRQDVRTMAVAAFEGQLDTRADSSRHQGVYQKIVQGFNDTMDSVVGPINEAAAVLEKLANNDLTARVEGDYKGDHAKIKNSLNTAIDTLHAAIMQVTEASDKVASSAQSLSATFEEVGKASQQVAETIGQVSAGSQEQSKTVQASAVAMEQLTRAIQEIAAGAQSQAKTVEGTVSLVEQSAAAIEMVAKLSQEATENGRQVAQVASAGGQQVEDAVGSMGKIKQATDQVAAMVRQLGESSQQIGAIVETIDDIAEQTNLLALNAAIEAARAGEHGKGFAVVADEVRKLAERSSKATGEIAELITTIQNMTTQAVEAMDRGSRQVEEGAELGNQAGEALGNIQSAINGIVNQIENMSTAAEQMAASSSEVIRAIENVSAITEETTAAAQEMSASSTEVVQQIEQVAAVSEENAAAAEEVYATTEEQNAAVEEMTAASGDLAIMADQLQELVSQFKTDDSATTTLRTAGGEAPRHIRRAA